MINSHSGPAVSAPPDTGFSRLCGSAAVALLPSQSAHTRRKATSWLWRHAKLRGPHSETEVLKARQRSLHGSEVLTSEMHLVATIEPPLFWSSSLCGGHFLLHEHCQGGLGGVSCVRTSLLCGGAFCEDLCEDLSVRTSTSDLDLAAGRGHSIYLATF